MKGREKCPGSFLRLYGRVIVLCLAATLASCQGKSEKPAIPAEKSTIAYSVSANAALFHVAASKGFFPAEGLDVVAQRHEFGKLAMDSLLGGKADLATQSDTVFMFAAAEAKKICIIAVISTTMKGNGIVARKDRGIAGPQDLKKKTIGVPLGTAAEFFLDSFLSTRRIGRKEIEIIDLKPGELTQALALGKIDAACVWNPALTKIQKELGEKGVVFYDETLYSDIFCVSARQEFVEKNPETVKKVLRAFLRAEAFVKKNPEESRRLVSEFTDSEKSLIDETWDLFDFKVTLEQSLLISLEDQTRWAQRNGMNRGEMPNYLDFIYADGLRSVKPEAVRIIR